VNQINNVNVKSFGVFFFFLVEEFDLNLFRYLKDHLIARN
jgi:hypothetical protein